MSLDDNFNRVAPEAYSRLKNPSLKQFHDFVRWLTEATVSELDGGRGNTAATRSALIRYLQRGLRADLLLAALMDQLPIILSRADYPPAEASEIIAMLKQINFDDLGIRRTEMGVTFDDSAA
jgi:hypothetical protein